MLLTTQNIFITNLAISDLLMCIFTIPITLMDILKYWPDGDNFQLVNIETVYALDIGLAEAKLNSSTMG